MNDPDGVERAARAIADWDGERMEEYADEVYPELRAIWEEMQDRRAAPVAVYVPPVPLDSRLRVPIIAYVQGRRTAPHERTMEAVVAMASESRPDSFRPPDIALVELPAGPACRLQEVVVHDEEDRGRRSLSEHIDYYVLPPHCPEGIFKFSVTWSSPAITARAMVTADEMAASLSVRVDEATEGNG
ncbi:hypothetical protein ACTWP5_07070 [Streptomyces sp. 4N509B]|uniref:hypothetical protein n=1 Tax=Streptomyces sp. 4N509B TaxID=3457413 RepID=UPI003FD292E2